MGKARPPKNVPQAFKQRNRKNKNNKSVITFDEAARNEWLTGFSKRKNERRKRAQHEEIERLKEEKRRIKKEKREERDKQLEEMRAAVRAAAPTEMETIAEPKEYDMSTHTVTVVDVTSTDFVGSTGLHLGFNNVAENEEESIETQTPQKGAEECEDGEQTEEKPTRAAKKRPGKVKRKGKKHKNLTHLMDKRTLAKRAKFKENNGSIKKHSKVRRRK